MQALQSAEETLKAIRGATERHFSTEEKNRIILEVLRGEDSFAELCRNEGIAQYVCSPSTMEFLEPGKNRLAGDTARAATPDGSTALSAVVRQLKDALAEATLEKSLHTKA